MTLWVVGGQSLTGSHPIRKEDVVELRNDWDNELLDLEVVKVVRVITTCVFERCHVYRRWVHRVVLHKYSVLHVRTNGSKTEVFDKAGEMNLLFLVCMDENVFALMIGGELKGSAEE